MSEAQIRDLLFFSRDGAVLKDLEFFLKGYKPSYYNTELDEEFMKHVTRALNWVSRDLLTSIGQIVGAIATVWTARVALGQMKEARKQNELAHQHS